MLLYYLGKLKNQKFCTYARNTCQMLLLIIYPTDICPMSWKYVQRLTLCKYQHFTVCSFTFLSKLKALQLKQGRQSSINTVKIWHHGRCRLNQKHLRMQNVCISLFTKGFKMSTICTDTCLEMFSPLVNCSVDNFSRNVSVQMVLSFPR